MRKIKKYMVIAHENNMDITVSVTNLIADGWQPLGGPCRGDGRMHQAMVRYEESEQMPHVECEQQGDDDGIIGVVAVSLTDFCDFIRDFSEEDKRHYRMVDDFCDGRILFDGIEWTEEVRRIEDLKSLARRQTKPNTLPENRP